MKRLFSSCRVWATIFGLRYLWWRVVRRWIEKASLGPFVQWITHWAQMTSINLLIEIGAILLTLVRSAIAFSFCRTVSIDSFNSNFMLCQHSTGRVDSQSFLSWVSLEAHIWAVIAWLLQSTILSYIILHNISASISQTKIRRHPFCNPHKLCQKDSSARRMSRLQNSQVGTVRPSNLQLRF